jgi:hypothetical protein
MLHYVGLAIWVDAAVLAVYQVGVLLADWAFGHDLSDALHFYRLLLCPSTLINLSAASAAASRQDRDNHPLEAATCPG